MEKEKIILGNGTELSYDIIGFSGNTLVIGFVDGDAADLESKIRAAGQNNLEEIQQVGADGTEQAVHKLYDIFTAINKRIGAVEQESGKKAEVTDTLLMDALV